MQDESRLSKLHERIELEKSGKIQGSEISSRSNLKLQFAKKKKEGVD